MFQVLKVINGTINANKEPFFLNSVENIQVHKKST